MATVKKGKPDLRKKGSSLHLELPCVMTDEVLQSTPQLSSDSERRGDDEMVSSFTSRVSLPPCSLS